MDNIDKYTEYDEESALSLLLQNDKHFRRFYMEERKKIIKNIVWKEIPDLKAEMSFGNLPQTNEYVIASKILPVPIEYAFSAAHELQHLISCQEGYPTVRFINKNINSKINNIISDMINDPIVNKKIVKHGFDLWEYIDRSNEIQMKGIGIKPLDDQSDHNMVLLVTLFVKKALDWKTAQGIAAIKPNEYSEWFIKYYPELLPMALKLTEVVNKIGFDTPEQVAKILNQTINLLKYTAIMNVVFYN